MTCNTMTWGADVKLRVVLIVSLVLLCAIVGIVVKRTFFSTTHQKMGWTAEMFFDTPAEIELCKAIERNDVARMRSLIAKGANVNARGKGNMTPLLWAMFDHKRERFELLLQKGADPNIPLDAPLGSLSPGTSVTEIAAKSALPGYFELVMQHGGDPNFVNQTTKEPLLCAVILQTRDVIPRLKILLEKGADINRKDGAGRPPTMIAINWFNQYPVALYLLESGADPKAKNEKYQTILIDIVLSHANRVKNLTPGQQSDYKKLLDWLVEHGESIEESRKRRGKNKWDR